MTKRFLAAMPGSIGKRTFALLSAACLLQLPVPEPGRANSTSADAVLRATCGGMFDHCGYMDRLTGREVIPQQFERAMPFSEGLAAVRIEGRFGYIDETGKRVIPPRFDLAGPFRNGLAEVVVDKKAGAIDRTGQLVVPLEYGHAIPLTDKILIVQPGSFRSMQVPDFESLGQLGLFALRYGPAGLYHLEKGWLTAAEFEFVYFDRADATRIWARRYGSKSELFGLMSTVGRWQVEPSFGAVRQLNNGRAVVSRKWSKGAKQRSRWGAVDDTGRIVILLKYDSLSDWIQNHAVVRLDGREGFLKRDGTLLGGAMYEKVKRDRSGRPSKALQNGKWLTIRPDESLTDMPRGERRAPYRLKVDEDRFIPRKATDCDGGVQIVQKEGLWGLTGPDGEVFAEPRYEAITCFRQGVAWVPVRERRVWCPIGPDGQLRDKPACRPTHYSVGFSHHFPEKFDPDPFESNVLWMRAFLNHALDPTSRPPRLLGGERSIAASCRRMLFCDR